MNPKDQLDSNELEQNQELPWKELSDIKDNEIIGNLQSLEKKVDINIIKNTEKNEEEIATIEQTKEEEEKMKKEILSSKANKKWEYTPWHSNSEIDTLERANAGRINAAKWPKQLIQNGINTIEKARLWKRIITSRVWQYIKEQLI